MKTHEQETMLPRSGLSEHRMSLGTENQGQDGIVVLVTCRSETEAGVGAGLAIPLLLSGRCAVDDVNQGRVRGSRSHANPRPQSRPGAVFMRAGLITLSSVHRC